MNAPGTQPPSGDQVRVTIAVAVPPEVAFEIFTSEIDRWWRKGPKYRDPEMSGGFIRLEPGIGGRLFESVGSDGDERVFEVGRVSVWEPPSRLAFSWRNRTFVPSETTEVEVTFASTSGGTLVTVLHRGWTNLRPDHPARQGMPVAAFLRSAGLWWAEQMTSMRMFVEDLSQR
ncbi:MAG: SRPBCC domain-containing protein [Gammaproteobacteria bacterium]